MFDLPRKIVVFDTECTTWEGALQRNWSGPGECRELIQLGAVLVETSNFCEIAALRILVRPMFNPVLSDYCLNLTGITQREIDVLGIDFPVCLRIFEMWCRKYELYSFDKVYGHMFDQNVLVENCDLHGMELPFDPERFHNLNEIFLDHGVLIEQSGKASLAFGVEPKLRPHDALNDVRGLIDGLRLLRRKVV